MLLSSGNIWCFNSLCISTSTDYCCIQTMFVYINHILFLSIGLHVFLCLQVSVWDPFSSAPKSFFLKNIFKGFFLRFYLFILDRGGGWEKERETWMCGSSGTPPTGDLIWPAAQACPLTGNRTHNPLFRRPALNLLSYTCWAQIILH